VVEQPFSEIPRWHPLVKNVFPCAVRRWRKTWWKRDTRREFNTFKKQIQANQYDIVIDAQGLLKSAFITRLASGKRCGLNRLSAREPLAALFYNKKYHVPREQHAVTRNRQLFSLILNYPNPTSDINYGIDRQRLTAANQQDNYLVFLHGTTWPTKLWPNEYWERLGELAKPSGYKIKLPWGNAEEKQRAESLAAAHSHMEVLPKLNLNEIAGVLAGAKAIVAVDTGLGHLAAALDIPTLSLYGPTNPLLTGTAGKQQQHLQSDFACAPCLQETCHFQGERTVEPPCFSSLPPEKVWHALQKGSGLHI